MPADPLSAAAGVHMGRTDCPALGLPLPFRTPAHCPLRGRHQPQVDSLREATGLFLKAVSWVEGFLVRMNRERALSIGSWTW